MRVNDNSPIDDAEWQAQEHALREAPGRIADRRDAAYRLIATAVQSSPRSGPPVDFAADVASLVATHEAGFERLLSRTLIALFLTALAIFGAVYGGDLWRAVSYGYGGGALGWASIVAACVGVSWAASSLIQSGAFVEKRIHAGKHP